MASASTGYRSTFPRGFLVRTKAVGNPREKVTLIVFECCVKVWPQIDSAISDDSKSGSNSTTTSNGAASSENKHLERPYILPRVLDTYPNRDETKYKIL